MTRAEHIEKRRQEALRAELAAQRAKEAVIAAVNAYGALAVEAASAQQAWERSHAEELPSE